MGISYDLFTKAFLEKITDYDLHQLEEPYRTDMVDGYMRRALVDFRKNCTYDLLSAANDVERCFMLDINQSDLLEIVEIVSEGMVSQWLKPYLYRQEILENVLNTKDFTTYSPAELLLRIGNTYERVQKNYIQMIREYSYNHGDLTELHL